MTDVVVSVRVEEKLHDLMKLHDEINWSAVIRHSIQQKVEETTKIDHKRAAHACRNMDKLRTSGAFSRGKTSTEIIREWRNKRK